MRGYFFRGLSSLCFAISAAGCVGGGATHVPGVGAVAPSLLPFAGANPGLAHASTVGPQEEAHYANQSCAELKSLIQRYETGASIQTNHPKYSSAKYASVQQTIAARTEYLKKLYASKKC